MDRVYAIPPITKATIDNYIHKGWEPGNFVGHVLSNDLFGALGAADLDNRYSIFEVVRYIYNEAPRSCWGTNDVVRDWIKKFKEK